MVNSAPKISDDELYNLVLSVNKEFYDLVYKDPWFKKIFRNIEQRVIESQQTDFMVGVLGGPRRFCGREPQNAHPHIFVDEEIYQYRETLLIKAFDKLNTPQWIRERWLKIDNAFKKSIIKKSIDDCRKRYFTDEIIYEPAPKDKAA